MQLIDEERVNFAVPADYGPGSKIDDAVKGIIDKIANDALLMRLGKKG